MKNYTHYTPPSITKIIILSTVFLTCSPLSEALAQTTTPATTLTQNAATSVASSAPQEEQVIIKASHKKSDFVPKTSIAASKSPVALIDTPASISVVTQEQMRQRNVTNLGDALRYTPGVLYGGADDTLVPNIRGFSPSNGNPVSSNIYIDGLKQFFGATNLYANSYLDTYLLDRIEVLRGPPSVLYGQSMPGGVVSTVSKFANARATHFASVQGGNHYYFQGVIDYGDKIDDDGVLSYRFAGDARRYDGYSGRNSRREHEGFLPSITWSPDDDTKLTIYDRFLNTVGYPSETYYFPYNGSFDRSTYKMHPSDLITDPNYNKMRTTDNNIGYQLAYNIDPSWVFNSSLRYEHMSGSGLYLGSYGLVDKNGMLPRQYNSGTEIFDAISLEERFNGVVHTGNVKHDVMVGLSWQNYRSHYDTTVAMGPPLNILNPFYGLSNLGLGPDTPGYNYQNQSIMSNQEGVFVQDEAAWKNWHFLFGARYDWSNTSNRDATIQPADSVQKQYLHAFTYRGGFVYHFDNGIAPYFTYSQSFIPNSLGRNANNEKFDPQRGELYEFGVKYQPKNFNGFFSLAAFNITNTNSTLADPNNTQYLINTGTQKSKGIEAEAHTTVYDNISLMMAYTYMKDTRKRYGVTNFYPGAPAHTLSVFGSYTVPDGDFKGFGFNTGVNYAAHTLAGRDQPNNTAANYRATVPAYVIVNAAVFYDLENLSKDYKGMQIQVTVNNLLNELYVPYCTTAAAGGCTFGQKRQVYARLSYNW